MTGWCCWATSGPWRSSSTASSRRCCTITHAFTYIHTQATPILTNDDTPHHTTTHVPPHPGVRLVPAHAAVGQLRDEAAVAAAPRGHPRRPAQLPSHVRTVCLFVCEGVIGECGMMQSGANGFWERPMHSMTPIRIDRGPTLHPTSLPTADPFPPNRPTNYDCRKRFVRCVDNLKAIMMLLRDKSPITQYEVRACP